MAAKNRVLRVRITVLTPLSHRHSAYSAYRVLRVRVTVLTPLLHRDTALSTNPVKDPASEVAEKDELIETIGDDDIVILTQARHMCCFEMCLSTCCFETTKQRNAKSLFRLFGDDCPERTQWRKSFFFVCVCVIPSFPVVHFDTAVDVCGFLVSPKDKERRGIRGFVRDTV